MKMGGSDKGDDSANQGMPEVTSSPPEVGRGGGGLELFSLSPWSAASSLLNWVSCETIPFWCLSHVVVLC